MTNPLARDIERRRKSQKAVLKGEDPSVVRARELLAAKASESAAPAPAAPREEAAPVPPAPETAQTIAGALCHRCKGAAIDATKQGDFLVCRPCVREHGNRPHAEWCKCLETPAAVNPAAHYRPMQIGDMGFLVSTWANEAARLPIARKQGDTITGGHMWRARLLLNRWGARVVCDAEEHDSLWGWACVAKKHGHVPRVLFVYVRELFRGNGYARAMLSDLLGDDAVVGAKGYGKKDPKTGVMTEWPLPKGWRYSYAGSVEWALAETP